MTKPVFPKDFLWGAASSAPQVEGGYQDDGKGLSIWDVAPAKRLKTEKPAMLLATTITTIRKMWG